jgi:hypothetical protein
METAIIWRMMLSVEEYKHRQHHGNFAVVIFHRTEQKTQQQQRREEEYGQRVVEDEFYQHVHQHVQRLYLQHLLPELLRR